MMKVRVFFAWYDLWIGAYIDREKRAIYICLLPMIVIKIWRVNPTAEAFAIGWGEAMRGETHDIAELWDE